MPDTRVSVPLTHEEVRALIKMAEAECRHPREMLRWIFIQEARRRKMLPPPPGEHIENDRSRWTE